MERNLGGGLVQRYDRAIIESAARLTPNRASLNPGYKQAASQFKFPG
jgi:hypothetical protein